MLFGKNLQLKYKHKRKWVPTLSPTPQNSYIQTIKLRNRINNIQRPSRFMTNEPKAIDPQDIKQFLSSKK